MLQTMAKLPVTACLALAFCTFLVLKNGVVKKKKKKMCKKKHTYNGIILGKYIKIF